MKYVHNFFIIVRETGDVLEATTTYEEAVKTVQEYAKEDLVNSNDPSQWRGEPQTEENPEYYEIVPNPNYGFEVGLDLSSPFFGDARLTKSLGECLDDLLVPTSKGLEMKYQDKMFYELGQWKNLIIPMSEAILMDFERLDLVKH